MLEESKNITKQVVLIFPILNYTDYVFQTPAAWSVIICCILSSLKY